MSRNQRFIKFCGHFQVKIKRRLMIISGICPITSKVQNESELLRVHLKTGISGVNENCDIVIEQLQAINNSRLCNRIGILEKDSIEKVKENLKIILDLE